MNERRSKLSVAVLAGGRSRRMGTDKRLLPIDGVPLLRRAVELAGEATDDVMVVVSTGSQLPTVLDGLEGWRLLVDVRPDSGPLAGIEVALGAALHGRVVVLPTDMPRLPVSLITMLADALYQRVEDCAALVHRGSPQPLPIALKRSSGAAVSALLDANLLEMRSLFEVLAVRLISETEWRPFDPRGEALLNINRPDDIDSG